MTRYLLDVSALIALGMEKHIFHSRVASWALAQTGAIFLMCSITELGFVRIIAQVEEYDLDIPNSRKLLLDLKSSKRLHFEFLSDNLDISALPRWVVTPKQTTDGHLLELAKAHGAVLATFDAKIPGAFQIP